jgi:excisionase family DNA binding protein
MVTSNSDQKKIYEDDLLTVLEVAAYLRVSRVTVWRWCREGILPASQVGRNWRIHRDDLLNFLASSRHEASSSIQPRLSTASNGT